MNVKKRGLGRGLDALLAPKTTTSDSENSDASADISGLTYLPVDWLTKGKYQPRRDINPTQLEELANSIRNQGIMQPIVVRLIAEQRYEIIAGERRWRAARLAGLDKVPVIVRHVEDSDAIVMALIENIQREDLNPVEEASALQRLIDEFSLTQQEVAETVGKSRSAVANLLRLLNLTPEVRRFLEHGDIEMGHARALLPLASQQQLDAAKTVVTKSLSVRETEKLVKQLQQPLTEETSSDKPASDFSAQAKALEQRFGTGVKIQSGAKGRGKVVLEFRDEDHLTQLLAQLIADA
ncbi:ParB/RepB/Spo0J family partition protein [Maribrevibacterium harenarium]|uniref:Probable chromosome-partitioning protein ParB n=1 Tax=Maribrevibacterium harenarium TaxID=2589817 RepID=A0A501X490_9GAMM|nr:ParB/RepB/Spo0J family partition protein [Maribrevibacterium harenarium]TPE55237.1 ParB/RepB/Spo0J family partition protein [Maribrevibacterium harenarium]